MVSQIGRQSRKTLKPLQMLIPLLMQKLVVNQAIEAMGLKNTQLLATVFDGITRHSPEGLNFKQRAETVGWKQAVRERDSGTWDWTENRPINPR
jgi:enoyl-CoA hydratase